MSDFNRPAVPPMPAFVSCKLVYAARIASVSADALLLESGDNTIAAITMPPEWLAKHRPQPGNWLIKYPDGYVSVSPDEAFVRGCTPLDQWGLPVAQEPKYTVNLQGRLVNRASGTPIPDDEPVFIQRAQDSVARRVVGYYWEVASSESLSEAHINAVERRQAAFDNFAIDHPERMKEPS
jgi:hypothetical protein